jgi:DNA polymerase bacteriophage-type
MTRELVIPPLDAWYCTAAQARARALPGGLDNLGACLGLNIQKDKRGIELIKLLSMPQKDTNEFRYDADLLAEMYDYCLQDVRVERLAARATPPLTEPEHRDWVISEMVNEAGLKVDVEFAKAAAGYADEEIAEISAELTRITNGRITSPKQHLRIKEFLGPLIEQDDRVRKAVTVVKTDRRTGEESRKISLDRDARRKLKTLETEEPGTLPDDVADLIDLVDEAGRSSVSKYNNMVWRAGPDDRVRGAYIFSGAGQTGRFSSVGLQVHNLPRKTAKDPEQMRSHILKGGELNGVMETLSSMLRPSVIAEDGHKFVCGDWSAIEARVLPWVSMSEGGSRVLDIFAGQDKNPDLPDIYMDAAAKLYDVAPATVTPNQRQIGKVIILSSGYQGGYRAFQAMARAYGVSVTDTVAADIIRAWRSANEWACELWRDIEKAAKEAVRTPGEIFKTGRIAYFWPGGRAPLYCELPSGRILSYPDPSLDAFEGRGGIELELTAIKAQWKPKRGETKWGRVSLYGGLLAENVTQATAACILRHAMGLCVEDGWPLVGTTHDELLLEVRDDEVDAALEGLEAIMLDLPTWAEGLPMKCTLWNGRIYQK